MEITKAQYANDVFTTSAEAESRSRDMGLEGRIHVAEYNEQAVYIPGYDEEEYFNYYRQQAGIPVEGSEDKEETTVTIQITVKSDDTNEGQILKVDEEQRIIYGWASVITEKGEPVVDRQGDVIEADTLVKAVNEFMEHVRIGKTMHEGDVTGQVIHSLPVTKEICDALGIQCDNEGWVVAYKVYDEEVWKRVKSGELRAFSIGGRAVKEEYLA